MITRLETLVLLENAFSIQAIRRMIGAALDIIIQLGRMSDKSRKVLEISQVYSDDNDIIINPLYKLGKEGSLVKSGEWVGESV